MAISPSMIFQDYAINKQLQGAGLGGAGAGNLRDRLAATMAPQALSVSLQLPQVLY